MAHDVCVQLCLLCTSGCWLAFSVLVTYLQTLSAWWKQGAAGHKGPNSWEKRRNLPNDPDEHLLEYYGQHILGDFFRSSVFCIACKDTSMAKFGKYNNSTSSLKNVIMDWWKYRILEEGVGCFIPLFSIHLWHGRCQNDPHWSIAWNLYCLEDDLRDIAKRTLAEFFTAFFFFFQCFRQICGKDRLLQ